MARETNDEALRRVRLFMRRSSGLSIELQQGELMIKNEIEGGCVQRSIAQTYCLALRSTYRMDWSTVNAMIINRWSRSGLTRIKRLAWSGKCFD